MWFIKLLLLPFSLLYGLVMLIRNKLFDLKWIKSKKFDIPVICIGNLSMGGTGKTPHTEYLAALLKDKYHLAVISRGYRRKTRGFILANQDHKYKEIGDEPVQYRRKFPDLTIAVDEKRRRGIDKMIEEDPGLELIILDDGFQHRYVKPGLSILLTDYRHLYVNDYPLPTGTLREFPIGSRRADAIIITKTPRVFSPIVQRDLEKSLNPLENQKLFYSYIDYDDPIPVRHTHVQAPEKIKFSYIVLVTGIANSYPLQEHLHPLCNELIVMDYGDHHSYTGKDIQKILAAFNNIISKDKVIFTTEKDAMRLGMDEFSDYLHGIPMFYLPVRVRFHDCTEVSFDDFILDYVAKNKGKR